MCLEGIALELGYLTPAETVARADALGKNRLRRLSAPRAAELSDA